MIDRTYCRRDSLGIPAASLRSYGATLPAQTLRNFIPVLLKPLSLSRAGAARSSSLLVRKFSLLLALFLFAVGLCRAETASLGGRITDPSGALIRGAALTITNLNTGMVQTIRSDARGQYLVHVLTSGSYSIKAEAKGFKTYEANGVQLGGDRAESLNIRMEIGSNTETVYVDGSVAQINTEDATVGSYLSREMIENQPLNGRSLQSLLTLVPGVVQAPVVHSTVGSPDQLSVNGQRTDSNIFEIDGLSANLGAAVSTGNGMNYASGSSPSVNALGGTQSMIDTDALESIRVDTATYSAEYGRSPGGQFQLTSRAGGKSFHGSAYEYFRHEYFDANDWFANNTDEPRGKLRQHLYGGTLGGPLLFPHFAQDRDRTFFFAAFEGLHLVQPSTSVQDIPGDPYRAQANSGFLPILNGLPQPNGIATSDGWYRNTYIGSNLTDYYSGSLRLDHTFSPNMQVFYRFSKSPSDATTDSTIVTHSRTHTDSQSHTAGFTWMIRPKLLNDLRFNQTSGTYNAIFSTVPGADLFALLSPDTFPRSTSYANITFQDGSENLAMTQGRFGGISPMQVNLTDTATRYLRSHEIKFGVDLRWLRPSGVGYKARAAMQVSNDTALTAGTISNGTLYTNVEVKPTFANYSAFVQDHWKVVHRLSADIGLRWDISPPPGSANGISPYALTSGDLHTAGVAPAGTPLYATRYTNFAPRVGLNYQLRTNNGWETVVRAGGGFFYDTGTQASATPYQGIPFGNSKTISAVSLNDLKTIQLPSGVQNLTPPYTGTLYGVDPHLQSPLTYQWSLGIEQNLYSQNLLKVSYVGNASRHLLMTTYLFYSTLAENPNLKFVYLTRNAADSNYNSLQVEFHGHTSSHLQEFVSYVWSHSIDDSVMDQTSGTYDLIKGNSDANMPQVFRAGISLESGHPFHNKVLRAITNNWGDDLNITAQSGFPVNVTARTAFLPDGTETYGYPDRVAGKQFWIANSNAPGGEQLNPTAFAAAAGSVGTLGRNVIRGFAVGQANTSLRRTFVLTPKVNLQFRAEAYNLTNHANFGSYNGSFSTSTSPTANSTLGWAASMYGSSLGGLNALYQMGGPRSMQLVARVQF